MRVSFSPLTLALVLVLLVLAQPAAAQTGGSDRDDAMSALESLGAMVPPEAPDGGCLPREDMMARQVIELHTQLLVASLACGEVYGDDDLHHRYRVFTAEHADRIRDAQGRIERSLGSGVEAERLFDTYRTNLANAEAQLIQERSRGTYCLMRQARFNSLIGASPEAFDNYAEELAVRARLRAGGC